MFPNQQFQLYHRFPRYCDHLYYWNCLKKHKMAASTLEPDGSLWTLHTIATIVCSTFIKKTTIPNPNQLLRMSKISGIKYKYKAQVFISEIHGRPGMFSDLFFLFFHWKLLVFYYSRKLTHFGSLLKLPHAFSERFLRSFYNLLSKLLPGEGEIGSRIQLNR